MRTSLNAATGCRVVSAAYASLMCVSADPSCTVTAEITVVSELMVSQDLGHLQVKNTACSPVQVDLAKSDEETHKQRGITSKHTQPCCLSLHVRCSPTVRLSGAGSLFCISTAVAAHAISCTTSKRVPGVRTFHAGIMATDTLICHAVPLIAADMGYQNTVESQHKQSAP